MTFKYTYKDKKTGQLIYTNEKKNPKKYELITEVRGIEFDFKNLKQKEYVNNR